MDFIPCKGSPDEVPLPVRVHDLTVLGIMVSDTETTSSLVRYSGPDPNFRYWWNVSEGRDETVLPPPRSHGVVVCAPTTA